MFSGLVGVTTAMEIGVLLGYQVDAKIIGKIDIRKRKRTTLQTQITTIKIRDISNHKLLFILFNGCLTLLMKPLFNRPLGYTNKKIFNQP